ncbi:MAG: hypothetical protein WC054_08965 [Candidatus Nanopelagicales bacterium]
MRISLEPLDPAQFFHVVVYRAFDAINKRTSQRWTDLLQVINSVCNEVTAP